MSFSFKPTQVGGEVQAEATDSPSVSNAPASPNLPLGSMPLGGRDTVENKKNILQIILYIVFGLLVALTVVLFAYQRYLISRIEAQKQVLDEEDKALGALNLEGMRSLSNRMKVVSQVLSEHTSVSTAFRILEKSIENPVTYTKFNLVRVEGNKGYDLQLGATAPSYKAVAQQLDTLKSDEYRKDFIPTVSYDSLSLDPSGRVNFNLKMPILIQGKLPETVLVDGTALNNLISSTTVSSSSTNAISTKAVAVVATSTTGTLVASTTKK